MKKLILAVALVDRLCQPRFGRRLPERLHDPLTHYVFAKTSVVVMTNQLFPLPSWAPALWRVPTSLEVHNEVFTSGNPLRPERLARHAPNFAPFAAPLSTKGEDFSRFAPG